MRIRATRPVESRERGSGGLEKGQRTFGHNACKSVAAKAPERGFKGRLQGGERD
mgnify:CR=1 FL=1